MTIPINALELRLAAADMGVLLDREYVSFLLIEAAKRIERLEQAHGTPERSGPETHPLV